MTLFLKTLQSTNLMDKNDITNHIGLNPTSHDTNLLSSLDYISVLKPGNLEKNLSVQKLEDNR